LIKLKKSWIGNRNIRIWKQLSKQPGIGIKATRMDMVLILPVRRIRGGVKLSDLEGRNSRLSGITGATINVDGGAVRR